jgi:photosystem II stability/assembly factor-like uncharacterized protein
MSDRIRLVCVIAFLYLLGCPHRATAQQSSWHSIHHHHNLSFRGLACADRMNCGAVATDGNRATILLTTTDGGVTWDSSLIERFEETGYLPAGPFDVANPSPGVFLIAADSGIAWTTSDCGRSFRKLQFPTSRLTSAVMWDERRGAVALNMNQLYLTSDGWQTHHHAVLPDSIAKLGIIQLIAQGADTLVALVYDQSTDRKLLLISHDPDSAWIVRSVARDVQSISIPDAHLIVAARSHRIGASGSPYRIGFSRSQDFGETWQDVLDTFHTTGLQLNGISMADARFGIAYGPAYQVWATTDGGLTWSTDTTIGELFGAEQSFREVVAFEDRSAIAVMGASHITGRSAQPSSVFDPRQPSPSDRSGIAFDPVSGVLSVRTIGGPAADIPPAVFDIAGRKLQVTALLVPSCAQHAVCWRLDLQGVARGIYIVTVPGHSRSLRLAITGDRR